MQAVHRSCGNFIIGGIQNTTGGSLGHLAVADPALSEGDWTGVLQRSLRLQVSCDSVLGRVKLSYQFVSKILVSDLHCGSVICIADFCCTVCKHLLHGTPSDVSM